MSTRIPLFPPASLDHDQRDLYDEITSGPRATGPQHFALVDELGALRGPFNALLLSPPLGRAVQQLGAAIRYRSTLESRERELAVLLVAARWDSAFERESHEAVGRAAGLTDAELAALRAGSVEPFDQRERLVGDVVLGMLNGDVDDALWSAAEHELGASVVFELSTLVGYYAMLALQLRVFRIDSYGFTQ